jgi:hypothetical protein
VLHISLATLKQPATASRIITSTYLYMRHIIDCQLHVSTNHPGIFSVDTPCIIAMYVRAWT